MHLLLTGSLIATMSAWAVVPDGDVFDTGLASHFASAMEQSQDDCAASSLIVDGGTMLVVLDEQGDVTEIELGEMPRVAEQELRMAIPSVFAGAPTSISADALMCAAMGSAEESDEEEEVEVSVSVLNGDGQVVIEHNGERKVIEIDLGDLNFETIAEEMGNAGVDLNDMMGRLMSGDASPEVRAEVVVEMVDEDGERHHRRMHVGGEDHGGLGEHMTMMFVDEEGGHWSMGPGGPPPAHRRGHPEMGGDQKCSMCPGHGGMGNPRMPHHGGMGMGGGMMPHSGMGGMPGHGGMEMHFGGMSPHGGTHGGGHPHGKSAEAMLQEHMHFLMVMQDDPESAWGIIESLPPEMRAEHEELLEQLMHGGHAHDSFVDESMQFDHKIDMARKVSQRLNDEEAVAVFGVWQAREHLEPEAQVALLAPMMNDMDLRTSVRNAASFVVMEALGHLDDSAGATETLRDMILRNGRN